MKYPNLALLRQMEQLDYAGAGLAVGMEVGFRGWPYHGSHPGCWQEPIKGIALSRLDVRAWQNTIAFKNPTQEQVAEHVAWCYGQGLLHDAVPVLNLTTGEIHFRRTEGTHGVVPYALDVDRWKAERDAALRHYADVAAERPHAH